MRLWKYFLHIQSRPHSGIWATTRFSLPERLLNRPSGWRTIHWPCCRMIKRSGGKPPAHPGSIVSCMCAPWTWQEIAYRLNSSLGPTLLWWSRLPWRNVPRWCTPWCPRGVGHRPPAQCCCGRTFYDLHIDVSSDVDILRSRMRQSLYPLVWAAKCAPPGWLTALATMTGSEMGLPVFPVTTQPSTHQAWVPNVHQPDSGVDGLPHVLCSTEEMFLHLSDGYTWNHTWEAIPCLHAVLQ